MIHPPCIGYKIIFSDDTKKDLKKIEQQTIRKIFKRVKNLNSSKLDSLKVKKLKSRFSLYRFRAGDYRIIYCIKHKKNHCVCSSNWTPKRHL